ncbi:predicted protein [Nematostella vectensis]|uniref:GST C-terminal domain-containing protein n=1 Tax=Nematostella vectensis TaxID=45351 RepID=A7SU84_NEMVE|nr:predicted protein [Nematostella vectensis]|eukprot:XP_001624833.1 predicted protein [Nematostella vectensis]
MAECFNSWIKADGSTDFPPEANRYHLYIGYSCPFAARPFTVWKLKGLETVISINFTDPFKLPNETWKFSPEKDSCTADEVNGFSGLKEVYLKADPNFKGKISVPLLWDKKTGTAVNNDSVEIMRMLNSEFNAFCPTKEQRSIDLRPSDLQDKMEDINAWVGKINFGVYVAGLAPNQQRYDEKVEELFQYLDKAEDILSRQRYLLGDKMTETDIRLFTTLVRFDVVYHGLFKVI